MIFTIINTYFPLFLSVGVGGLIIFLAGVTIILRRLRALPDPSVTQMDVDVTSENDVTEFAGEDVTTTQLDLARAYLEINQKAEAINILKSVAQSGTEAQRKEAEQLLSFQ